jgi:hypothetical protein
MQRMVAGHRRVVWDECTEADTSSTGQRIMEESSQVRSGHLRALSPWILKKKEEGYILKPNKIAEQYMPVLNKLKLASST